VVAPGWEGRPCGLVWKYHDGRTKCAHRYLLSPCSGCFHQLWQALRRTRSVLETWTKAFAASDVDGIVKLYAPDALFLDTSSKTVVVKPEGIRSYFENALLNNMPRGATLKDYAATSCLMLRSSSQA